MIDRLIDTIKEGKAKDLILYHGSKGGIDGQIEPCSRARCDFGRGFYMGTDLMQAKSIVSNDDMPCYYKLKFRISEIPRERILILDEKHWLRTVLACRHADEEYDMLDISKKAMKALTKCDVVIGKIADDKMREAMAAYIDNALTDKGLYACLTSVDYGLQIVAKTKEACSKIDILEEKRLKGKELDEAIDFSAKKRQECRNIVARSKKEYADIGRTFYQMIRHEKSLEKNKDER